MEFFHFASAKREKPKRFSVVSVAQKRCWGSFFTAGANFPFSTEVTLYFILFRKKETRFGTIKVFCRHKAWLGEWLEVTLKKEVFIWRKLFCSLDHALLFTRRYFTSIWLGKEETYGFPPFPTWPARKGSNNSSLSSCPGMLWPEKRTCNPGQFFADHVRAISKPSFSRKKPF